MDKGEKKMNSALKNKYPNLKVEVDYKKLLKNFELPTSKNNTIILNPKNPTHVRWYEDEDGDNK
jgi:bifunctional pyridoxal-dependent enzyme with beta-cystathionase and maltose regulon repressor activities